VRNLLSAATLILAASSIAAAQAPTSPQATISHTTKAMHYRPQGGSVKVEFQSSSRMPSAAGGRKVEGKKTNVEIDRQIWGLEFQQVRAGISDLPSCGQNFPARQSQENWLSTMDAATSRHLATCRPSA
jgi:hypothetical protein